MNNESTWGSGMKLVMFGVGCLAAFAGYLLGDEVRRRLDQGEMERLTEQVRVLPTCNCRCVVESVEVGPPPWPEDKNKPEDWYDQ
jgi:hypothetical protein